VRKGEIMEEYIALCLFVVPGFLVKSILNKIDTRYTKKFDVNNLIEAIVYNIPNFMFVMLFLLITDFFNDTLSIKSISDLFYYFKSISFLLYFIVLSLFSSLLTALMIDFLNPVFKNIIDTYRSGKGVNKKTDEPTFNKIFEDNKRHVIEVEVEGSNTIGGWLNHFPSGDEDKFDIHLTRIDEFENLKETYFTKVKGVYYDFDNKVKITEFDSTLIECELKKVEEMKKKIKETRLEEEHKFKMLEAAKKKETLDAKKEEKGE